ncbi:MAG: four helix bundle protein [Candidatus Moraniibacteriota bacterium]|jgi:four helix bundle protein
MLKPYKDSYGYKKLLAYEKAEDLQMKCSRLTHLFPFSKTLSSLADQMDRSARSGKQNIVEGWRRNTTREYYDFLGFSIGAVAELEEDCDDIIRGSYPELVDKMGLKREEGEERGWNISKVEKLRFYPLDLSLPLVIQLKLQSKELNFLLKKLQDSLEQKMKNESTLSLKDKSRIIEKKKLDSGDVERKIMEENGLIRLEDGKFIPKEVYDRIRKNK